MTEKNSQPHCIRKPCGLAMLKMRILREDKIGAYTVRFLRNLKMAKMVIKIMNVTNYYLFEDAEYSQETTMQSRCQKVFTRTEDDKRMG